MPRMNGSITQEEFGGAFVGSTNRSLNETLFLTKESLPPMMDKIEEVIRTSLLIVGALFPLVDSPENIPIFLTLTSVLARKIAVYGFGLLLVSILIGTHILVFFGISLPAVQVGGGIVLFVAGW